VTGGEPPRQHATLHTSLAWLEKALPEQAQAEGAALAVLELSKAVLTTGKAVEVLSRDGYWRECMTLARSALEMTLTATLLAYEPGRYTEYRDYGIEVFNRLRGRPPQGSRRLHWFYPKEKRGKKGFAGVVEAVEQYAPNVSEVVKNTYDPACSFAHSDFLSLMVSEPDTRDYVLRWGCRVMGIAAYLTAQLVDVMWNNGQLVDQILKDQDLSLDRELDLGNE